MDWMGLLINLLRLFNIDGFIVESIKIGQSAIFNGWMFLFTECDMLYNIDISNIYRTNEMIHTILLLLLCNHPCPTYTLLQLAHFQVHLLAVIDLM
jgi:hypothetical protein